LSDRPFKSNDASTRRLLKVNSYSHPARASEKLLLHFGGPRRHKTRIFSQIFLALPGPYKKLGLRPEPESLVIQTSSKPHFIVEFEKNLI
jgi:hypothetical protein